MRKINYVYICTLIGNLSGVPIRLYDNGKLTYYHSMAQLPKDPLSAYESEVLKINAHIGYFITPTFHYYGIVSDERRKIVIGPTIQTESNDWNLRELALRCNVPHEDTEAFVSGMRSIVHMPLESILYNERRNAQYRGHNDIRFRAGRSAHAAEARAGGNRYDYRQFHPIRNG